MIQTAAALRQAADWPNEPLQNGSAFLSETVLRCMMGYNLKTAIQYQSSDPEVTLLIFVRRKLSGVQCTTRTCAPLLFPLPLHRHACAHIYTKTSSQSTQMLRISLTNHGSNAFSQAPPPPSFNPHAMHTSSNMATPVIAAHASRKSSNEGTHPPIRQPVPLQPHQHPAQHQHQQHNEIHQMTSNWNVPRTRLSHYPQKTQEAILAGRGRQSKQGKLPKHQSAASLPGRHVGSPRTTQRSASIVELIASLNTLLEALRYEASKGYSDVKGKSETRFSQFAASTLRSAAQKLSIEREEGLSQRCTLLADRMASYSVIQENEVSLRVQLVDTVASAVTSIIQQLQSIGVPRAQHGTDQLQEEASRPARWARDTHDGANVAGADASSAAAPAAPNGKPQQPAPMVSQRDALRRYIDAHPPLPAVALDPDELAAEAHAEETMPPHFEDAGTHQSAADILPGGGDIHQNHGQHVGGVDEDDQYVVVGGRRIKRETQAYRKSFFEAALRQASKTGAMPRNVDMVGGSQRTETWLSLRARRLTASAFSKALGFFDGDRMALWEEKVGLKAPFAGNAATQWGTKSEALALENYCHFTGQTVEQCMFKMKRDDPPHAWLGASPDGLLPALSVKASEQSISKAPFEGALPTPNGPGILEIKCPYNKGNPELAVPPSQAIWYYMPQLQGLMDVFDREWCHLYVWTPCHGSVAFLVARDRRYWAACFEVLADFWWCNVVPARQARDAGAEAGDEALEALRPSEKHPSAQELKAWSKRLAAAAPATRFPVSSTLTLA
jgi:putative phage-type endonuclease